MRSVGLPRAQRRMLAVASAAAALALAACTPNGKEEAFRPIAVGEPVPEFAVRTLAGDSARIAEGWTTHACVDAHTLRPTRLPQWMVDAIARAES